MSIPPFAATHTPLFHFSNRTDDSDSVEEHDHRDEGVPQRVMFKSSGACVHCKSLKVRCEFSPGEAACQRCQAGNYQCLPRGRKKRKPAPTHEDLQEKAHNQDLQIQALLLQFDKLRADRRINDRVARAQSLDVRTPGTGGAKRLDVDKPKWTTKSMPAEVATASFFSPGRSLEELALPDIVKHCSLYPEEIVDLFTIFFERINPYFSILDPGLHTPEKLIWTSPFLFTVICAVASRYYADKTNLYHLAMDFARDAAGRALIDGSKSVDVCQAYLLMGVYPVPKKRWAEDRSWLLMGVAIRMAIELELNQPPPPACDERESLNRTRTWLNCYCVDGSHAIQFGKLPMLRLDDYIARNSRQWYKSSPMNIPFDIHLCAYVQIIILVAEWRSKMGDKSTRRCNDGLDTASLVLETQEKLSQEMASWVEAYAEEYTYLPLAICAYRGNTTQMITSYLRLVVLAVGFQHSAKSNLSRNSRVVVKSIQAAREVIQIMVERLYPTGNLRFAMEAHFLYVSFAAAFLINLLRPKFLYLLDENEQEEIIGDVERLIGILSSNGVALDERHTPALYSRFLSSLLAKHNTKPYRTSKDEDPNLGHTEDQSVAQVTQTEIYSWPDIIHNGSQLNGDLSTGDLYHVDTDMDFSLSHFVRTVTQNFDDPTRLGSTVESMNVPSNLEEEFLNPQHWPPAASQSYSNLWR